MSPADGTTPYDSQPTHTFTSLLARSTAAADSLGLTIDHFGFFLQQGPYSDPAAVYASGNTGQSLTYDQGVALLGAFGVPEEARVEDAVGEGSDRIDLRGKTADGVLFNVTATKQPEEPLELDIDEHANGQNAEASGGEAERFGDA